MPWRTATQFFSWMSVTGSYGAGLSKKLCRPGDCSDFFCPSTRTVSALTGCPDTSTASRTAPLGVKNRYPTREAATSNRAASCFFVFVSFAFLPRFIGAGRFAGRPYPVKRNGPGCIFAPKANGLLAAKRPSLKAKKVKPWQAHFSKTDKPPQSTRPGLWVGFVFSFGHFAYKQAAAGLPHILHICKSPRFGVTKQKSPARSPGPLTGDFLPGKCCPVRILGFMF